MPKNNAEESLVKFGILSILIALSVASVILAAAVGLIERQEGSFGH